MRQFQMISALVALWSSVFVLSIHAQTVGSLKVHQQQIEATLKESLSVQLEPHEYVIKVDIDGVPVATRNQAPAPIVDETVLPGFEPTRLPQNNSSSSVSTIPTAWEVTSLKINLILYKEIPDSFKNYIEKVVPVVSGMIPERGDQFQFTPILPEALESEAEKASFWSMPLTWLLVAGLLVLLLVGALLLRKLGQLQETIVDTSDANKNASPAAVNADAKALVPDPFQEQQAEQKEQMKQMLQEGQNSKMVQEIIKHLVGREDWLEQFLNDMRKDSNTRQQLAQFMAILGNAASRQLFASRLGTQDYLEVEDLASNIEMNAEERYQVLANILHYLTTQALVAPETVQSDPFSYLSSLTIEQIQFLVEDEPVKIKAIVLSRLDSQQVSNIVQNLEKDERHQVMLQLGNLKDIPLELIDKVAYSIAEKVKDLPDPNTVAFDGVNMLVDMLGSVDAATRQDMLNNLKVSDQELSQSVEKQLFIFDSIPVVPQDLLTIVIRKQDPNDVITAIVGADETVQRAVILCFPENIRPTLISSLKSQKPDPKLVLEKRQPIVRAFQKLGASGDVDLLEIYQTWEKPAEERPAIEA